MPERDERYLGLLMSDSARLLRTVFDRRVRPLGLTKSQWLVLRRLDWHPGASQSELADIMEMEKATAGRLIDRLEENGWVERRPDPADRRINRVYMTEKGERVNNMIRPISRDIIEEALDGMSKADREKLIDLMVEVKRRFQIMAEEGIPELPVEADREVEEA